MYPKPISRNESANLFFYYNDPATGKRRKKSCNTSKKGEAHKFIKDFMDSLTRNSTTTFRNYSLQYLDYKTNPRRIRYTADGKNYGERYCQDLKGLIENYVYKYRIADIPLGEITRGDILDLRATMQKEFPENPRTINKAIKALASILSEAYFRGDIKTNPALKIGEIKYKTAERGTFTVKEIKMFYENPDKWSSKMAYSTFMFAAFTGRRASEITALEWEQIDGKFCNIDRAWKVVEKRAGNVKWDGNVKIPLAEILIAILPEKTGCKYVFNNNAKRIAKTWWLNNFRKSMEVFDINYQDRNLTPHSFRHSLNTNLLLAGVYDLYVKKYMGWTDRNRDTQSVYTHIKPEHLMVVADKIDEIYTGKGNIIEFQKEA